jgi:hypothetical protein
MLLRFGHGLRLGLNNGEDSAKVVGCACHKGGAIGEGFGFDSDRVVSQFDCRDGGSISSTFVVSPLIETHGIFERI